MNASEFMDKQIMDLSRSKTTDLNNNTNTNPNTNDFLDLMNPQSEDEDNHGGSSFNNNNKKDQILPSYDFHPISRPTAAAVGVPSLSSDAPAAAPAATSPRAASRVWNSLDSKPNRSYSSLEAEPEKVVMEKAQKLSDSAIMSEIDCTMKTYTDSLLHAIDGLSARLSQLESRTRQIEYSVDDLKVSIGNNHGSADGKMRHLENLLLQVQSGMQDVKDKQEVMEGHLQLAKLQISKAEKSSEAPNAPHLDPPPQSSVSSAPPQQSQFQQFPVAPPQPVPSLSPNAPPPPPQQNIQPPPVTTQFPPSQIPPGPPRDSYFPPPGQTQEAPSQHYQMPLPPQHQQQTLTPPVAPQPQQYPPNPTPPYPQPPPPQQQQQHQSVPSANAPPQFQPALTHRPEENPYIPPQSYPPNLHAPASQQSSGAPHSQPYYGSPSPMYEPPPPGRSSSSGFSSGYGPPSGPTEPYPSYSGPPPSHYGSSGSSIKPQPHSPGAPSSNYPKIPTARILPQAIPTASGISDGPSSGGGGNRVPVDDVIDKVTTMGFPREHVRATVRRLTENGQSVDLNIVLDKLMNDGEVQPQRGWFGR